MVALDAGEERASVLEEAPLPDPLGPRYVVRDARNMEDQNILATQNASV